MQEEELKKITVVLDRYRPADPLSDDKQLFDEWLPHVGRHRVDVDIDPDSLRTDALERILSRDGPLGILKLARKVELPNLVGPILDRTSITEPQLLELLEASINPPAPGELAQYASAIGAERYGSHGKTVRERILAW